MVAAGLIAIPATAHAAAAATPTPPTPVTASPQTAGVSPKVAAALAKRHAATNANVTTAQVAAAQSAPFKAVERVAVIELSFPNRPFPFSNDVTQQQMARVDSYIREVSYGKRSVTATVFGPFQSPANSCSGTDRVREGLALADPSIDYTQFDSFYVVYDDRRDDGTGCSGAGGSVFQADMWSTQDGNVAMGWAAVNVANSPDQLARLYTHEFGHNQGLGHADLLLCGTDPLRADTMAPTPEVDGPNGCHWHEYGDPYDTMGSGLAEQYNAPHRNMLGFFDPALGNERVQDVVAAGTYTLDVLETPAGSTPRTKALRLTRGVNGPDGLPEHLWVEYRQPVAGTFDSVIDPSITNGVVIHTDNIVPGRTVDTQLVYPTSGSNDPALHVGQYLYDPVSNTSITLVSKTTTQATVTVMAGRFLTCAPATPTVFLNTKITFTPTGGIKPYVWSAPDGSPNKATRATFTTQYSTPGIKTVTLTASGGFPPAHCTVEVLALVCTVFTGDILDTGVASFSVANGVAPFTWSAPGGHPATGTGTSFGTSYSTPGNYTVTVKSANKATTQCTVHVSAHVVQGGIEVSGTKAGGNPIGGTSARASGPGGSFGPTTMNPAFFDVAPGTYTISSTALAGYTVLVGSCAQPMGSSGCAPSSFAPASCNPTDCTFSAAVADQQNVNVEFRYAKWSVFRNRGGSIVGTPSIVAVNSVRYDVYGRGTDGTLKHSIGGTTWETIPGAIASDPVAVAIDDNHVDVFARGTNNRLIQTSYIDGVWSEWTNVGSATALAGTPTVVNLGGPLDAYYRDSSNRLRHVLYNGTKWLAPVTVGTNLVGDPVATSWALGRVDVFWRGANNALMHRGGTGATSDPTDTLATNLAGVPSVATWGANHLDLAWRGTDNHIYSRAYDGSWAAAQDLGSGFTADPSVVDRSIGDTEVFVRAADGSIQYKVRGATWPASFTSLGGTFTGGPVTIAVGAKEIQVVATAADHTLSIATFG